MIPAARVVPNLPSFSVDSGFWYSIPGSLSEAVQVGSIVRIPLGGRRVRGWVLELASREEEGLREVGGVSGAEPVFDASLLRSLTWAAHHYVAPVSSLLNRATPPNLPSHLPDSVEPTSQLSDHPLGSLAVRSAGGAKAPIGVFLGPWAKLDWLLSFAPVLEAGGSVLLVVATVAEAKHVGAGASDAFGEAAVVVGEDAAATTAAWGRAQAAPRLVVGTPKIAAWSVRSLKLAVVIEESRRAMKDRQTPTIHVRDLLATRSRIEGFNLGFLGPTPGVEVLATGPEVIRTANRAWPLVEVARADPDDRRLLTRQALSAIKSTADRGGTAFVYSQRHVSKDVAIPEAAAEEINRRSGGPIAGPAGVDMPVTCGTERDLAGLGPIDLAVALDVDAMLMGTSFRTSEEALRQLARLAMLVKSRSGSRLMLQARDTESPLVAAMRRGDPLPYLEEVLVERARAGWPPSSEMLAVEVRGKVPIDVAGVLSEAAPGSSVMGPLEIDEGSRWLMTGDLGPAKKNLRKIVQRWRDQGSTVRIDVDPIDV